MSKNRGKPLPFATREQIKQQRAAGTPLRTVAKTAGVAVNTVVKYTKPKAV